MIDIDRAPVAPPWLAARRKPHCLLCGGVTVFTNIYIPGRRSPAAPPPGKRRMIIYSLCESCAGKLDTLAEVIEAKIENELRSSGAI